MFDNFYDEQFKLGIKQSNQVGLVFGFTQFT